MLKREWLVQFPRRSTKSQQCVFLKIFETFERTAAGTRFSMWYIQIRTLLVRYLAWGTSLSDLPFSPGSLFYNVRMSYIDGSSNYRLL